MQWCWKSPTADRGWTPTPPLTCSSASTARIRRGHGPAAVSVSVWPSSPPSPRPTAVAPPFPPPPEPDQPFGSLCRRPPHRRGSPFLRELQTMSQPAHSQGPQHGYQRSSTAGRLQEDDVTAQPDQQPMTRVVSVGAAPAVSPLMAGLLGALGPEYRAGEFGDADVVLVPATTAVTVDGAGAVARLRQARPSVGIIAVTTGAPISPPEAVIALDAGADAVVR